MSTYVKYIGTADNYAELPVTGKQSVWQVGQGEERSDAEASLLLGTGLFSSAALHVTATTNPLSGVIEITASGKKVFNPVGRDFCKVLLPLNQSGGPSVLPTDYSGNDVSCTFGTVALPWANAGYFTSVGGSGKQEYIAVPNAAVTLNLSTDSFIVGMTINKATPAGIETIAGCSNLSTIPGLNLNINATGKLGPRLFTNGVIAATTYTAATVADAADHRIALSWDAPTKTLTSWVDGVKDVVQVAATVLSTDIITANMRIGMSSTGDTVDCKFAGFEWLTFLNSGLPVNMSELAVGDNAHRRTGMIGESVFL